MNALKTKDKQNVGMKVNVTFFGTEKYTFFISIFYCLQCYDFWIITAVTINLMSCTTQDYAKK